MSSISVVVPTRNRAALLARALRSILAQSHLPLEIVVVDDASTDDTRAAVEAMGAGGGLGAERLHYVAHERQRGAAAARNTGIRLARGEHLALLDDDDEWLPGNLEKTLAVLSASPPDVCAAYAGVHVVTASGEVASTRIPDAHPAQLADFLASTGFMTSAALLRRRCIEAVGLFDEELPGGQDHDLWIRLSERYAFLPVGEVLLNHYVHGDQITTDLPRKIRSKQMILAKHRALYERHPLAYARQLLRLGMLHCANSSLEEGRACLDRSLELDPAGELARDHLERSQRDPEAHRRFLLEEGFDRVGGITRFY